MLSRLKLHAMGAKSRSTTCRYVIHAQCMRSVPIRFFLVSPEAPLSTTRPTICYLLLLILKTRLRTPLDADPCPWLDECPP